MDNTSNVQSIGLIRHFSSCLVLSTSFCADTNYSCDIAHATIIVINIAIRTSQMSPQICYKDFHRILILPVHTNTYISIHVYVFLLVINNILSLVHNVDITFITLEGLQYQWHLVNNINTNINT